MKRKIFLPVVCVLLAMLSLSAGCSENSTVIPVAPGLAGSNTANTSNGNHSLLGYYECRVDPDSGIEFVPVRDTEFHLNALKFLEPPPPARILLSNFWTDGQMIDVDIAFQHPYLGLAQFTGFDVCGIVITSGSVTGFSDPDIVVAGQGETRLVNADGLTRWWNPREFPYNSQTPIFGNIDGVLGTPDSTANFTATLNGHKYHADHLSKYEGVSGVDFDMRGAFTWEAVNPRHYTIDITGGLVFNYAIDACWAPPLKKPPVVPDDFPPEANREEPFFLEAEITENTFSYNFSTGQGSGELGLDIKCYDWYNADANTVRVESPGVFDPVTQNVPSGGTSVYSTYHVDITDPVLTSADPVTIWVSAESGMDYEGHLPGKTTAAYMPPLGIMPHIQGGEIVLYWNDETVIDHPNRVDFNDIEPAVITNGDGDVIISFFWWRYLFNSWISYPLFITSEDHGHTFGPVTEPALTSTESAIGLKAYNNKLTLGSDGHAFMSYDGRDWGHVVQAIPLLGNISDSYAYNGTVMEHGGEMLYTSDGYPMMFGDLGGTIMMRRGDIPNVASSGTFPDFIGTEYPIVAEALINHISISRCTGLTSDGRAHMVFDHSGLPYIRMVSSTDSTGTSWDEPVPVFEGLAESWVGGYDPGLWIDDHDGFHVVWAGEYWWGEYALVYGYSADGADWDEFDSFKYLGTFPISEGLNDTEVVVFDAYGETWVFICYETNGIVYAVYKTFDSTEFSDPILVSNQKSAALPDIYPNGDTGVMFVYQADDGTGTAIDVYYRLAEFIVQ